MDQQPPAAPVGGGGQTYGGPGDGGGSSSSYRQHPQQQNQQQHYATYGQSMPPPQQQSPAPSGGLRRRHGGGTNGANNGRSSSFDDDDDKGAKRSRRMMKKLDMFPKVERDLKVQTEGGGLATVFAYATILVLVLAEVWTWKGQNGMTKEHLVVDTSLGKRMNVNINVTFHALACEDLHVDVMDVAGDSQIDIVETLVKRSLRLDGTPLAISEITRAEPNIKRKEQEKREKLTKNATLPDDYCGSCYGAGEEGQCCNSCEQLKAVYKARRWHYEALLGTADQCIRDKANGINIGDDRSGKGDEPKRMTKGQGCNLSGYMSLNRVAGNFHVAMGEGVEKNGRHIHQFVPEDAPNFNASHTIHELTFGPKVGDREEDAGPLNGVTKITTSSNGQTGLFQYFIKVVPTTYDKEGANLSFSLETNRYYFTERFRPLMSEMSDDAAVNAVDLGDEKSGKVGVHAGGATGGSHNHADHHKVQNAVLPGVFFVYEIYPFAVEVSTERVPFTHLLVRVMATVGGVFTFVGWADAMLYRRDRKTGKVGSLS